MDVALRERFTALWDRYFAPAPLPLALFYTDDPAGLAVARPAAGHRCVMVDLARVLREGGALCLGADGLGCFGGKRFLGFPVEEMPGFEHFLSYGIPGKLEGERYKKDPETVRETFARMPKFDAPARYFVAKRWDALTERDEPAVVVFLAEADALSGLFTLANYDEVERDAVVAPFGAGCASIVQYPFAEAASARPRCVLGTFDVTARPLVPAGTLSFAVPMAKLARMASNMDESFLTTKSWTAVHRRIRKEAP